jgi:hypothetical protein
MADPGQWRPEVPVDVVGQGLQWGDVEDPASLRSFRLGLGEETVECPEKCGEGLA